MTKIREVLQNYSDIFSPPADNTCLNGFIGEWGNIDCRNKNLTVLRKGWKQLTRVNGYLDLRNNEITSFDNLSGLTYVGDWFGYDYDKISDFSGLSNITYMRSFALKDNSYVRNVDFLRSLQSTESLLAIDGLPNLENLNGLSNYKTANYFYSYSSVNGKGYSYTSMFIANNPNLTDISGLKNVTRIHSRLYFDNRDYAVKLPSDSWLRNDGFDHIVVINSDGSQTTPDKSNICY